MLPGSSTGSVLITLCQFAKSLFSSHMEMGDPIVSPCRTPDSSSARSFSMSCRPPRP